MVEPLVNSLELLYLFVILTVSGYVRVNLVEVLEMLEGQGLRGCLHWGLSYNIDVS